MSTRISLVVAALYLGTAVIQEGHAWTGTTPQSGENNAISRRRALASATKTLIGGGIMTAGPLQTLAFSGEYENRDRKSNKDTVIREDY